MTKSKITIIASEATFENLATFETISELNDTVRKYKENFGKELNKTQLAVLDLLHRYSAKYKGVSFLTKSNIGKLIGKSRFTIIRVCKRLEELGIIKQYDMARSSDRRQTSCAIVIQPIEQNATPEIAENATPIRQHLSLKQIHNKDIRKEGDQPAKEESPTPLPSCVPTEFADVVRCYYDQTEVIFELWGKARLAWLKVGDNRPLEDYTELAIAAFRESIAAIKLRNLRKGKSLDSLRGYYYGTVYRMILAERRIANRAAFYDPFAM